mgnify:CR=1 FL=1
MEIDMNSIKKMLAIAVLLSFTLVTPSQALVLDTFDYSGALLGGNFSHTLVTPTTSVAPFVIAPINAIGGGVEYDIHGSVGENTVSTLFGGLPTGALTISMDAVPTLTEAIIVDMAYGAYDTTTGLPLVVPVDMTIFGDHFYYDVIQSDLGFDVTVTVHDFFGSMSSVMISSSAISEAAGPIRELLSFASFAGVDFTMVVGVDVSISALGDARDLIIGEFGVIPEPSVLAILGLALVVLGLRRRPMNLR